ncbi:MAG: hypothetical protein LBC92_02940 [Rickettsiales bacterium]|jgi:hypothetical protein|nr:hypothetical protein [Rickettsiales bacterium]
MKKLIFIFFIVFLSSALADDYDIYDSSGGTKSNYAEPRKTNSNRKLKKEKKKKNNKNKIVKTSRANDKENNETDEDEEDDDTVIYPNMQGQVLTEYNFSSNRYKVFDDKSRSNSYLYSNAEIALNLHKYFFAGTEWTFRPVSNRLAEGDRYANAYPVAILNDFYGAENRIRREKFHTDDYGLFVNQLNMNFKNSNLAIGAGKIEASFASAYSKYRFMGTNGIDMPLEYALKDKIGGYLAALFPFGTLQFNIFHSDTSYLSNTMFNRIGKDDLKRVSGYTNKLNNFSLFFDGTFDDLTISLGWRNLKSRNDITENGYSFSLEYLKEYDNSVRLSPFMEAVYINNFNSVENRDAYYLTSVLPLFFENWHFLLSNTIKYDDAGGTLNNNNGGSSYLSQISFGYKFNFGLSFNIAKVWQRKRLLLDNDKYSIEKTDSWNFVISYLYSF